LTNLVQEMVESDLKLFGRNREVRNEKRE
jgi:hypothetical protein